MICNKEGKNSKELLIEVSKVADVKRDDVLFQTLPGEVLASRYTGVHNVPVIVLDNLTMFVMRLTSECVIDSRDIGQKGYHDIVISRKSGW